MGEKEMGENKMDEKETQWRRRQAGRRRIVVCELEMATAETSVLEGTDDSFPWSFRLQNMEQSERAAGLRAAGLPIFSPRVWAGPGPETCGPGRAWAKHSRCGSGLDRALA
ncbi:hypothetical protein LSAT2_011387 [Lamellibrachia satsuma]|nr:hypothetical protein LSAT2_011387 [Lamellibrachia satsuma]